MKSRSGSSLVSMVWLVGVVASMAALPAAADVSEQIVLQSRPAVVNVERSVAHGLNGEKPGTSGGTAFLVDAERGLLVTNRHISGTSPARILVTFINGETTAARRLHYDAFHDFAILQIDPSTLSFPIGQLPLGDSFALNPQDEVVLIGNNDAEEYSVKFGRVTNLVLDAGDRHSATFQTSFDRAGGSSGSPVINARGEVVGLHYKGSSTTSFELRIEYVKDALEQLERNGRVRRGELGIELDLLRIADARDHFALPQQTIERLRRDNPQLKWLLFVNRVIARTPAAGVLRPGDIVLEVDGRRVGDDLYGFDRRVDAHAGGEVTLAVHRNGRRLDLSVPVLDAETTKARRFAVVAGGVFQDLNPELRRRYDIRGEGVFLAQAGPGTPMSDLGESPRSHPSTRTVVIEEFAGHPTPDLDAFVRAVRSLEADADVHLLMCDERAKDGCTVDWITLVLKYDPLRVFDWDPERLDWVDVESD